MRTVPAEFDVVVAGGGPAGSATAGLLAQKGFSVLLLEREKFPRYHIGESLITGVMPTLDELGVRDRIDAMGTVKKYGGTFRWGKDQGIWDFRFPDYGLYEHAYEVRRADFDSVLLARARELGVTVIEEAAVKAPVFDGDRIVGVEYAEKGQEGKIARSQIFIDASGQQHILAKKFDLIEWQEDLRNVAVWSYFAGCDRYEGARAGDITVENRPSGWFWFIPLSDGTVSIGYVTPANELKNGQQKSLEATFHEELARTEELRNLTKNAYPVSQFRTGRDWSYVCRRFFGPGWALVGDAAAFIDPLLSTGVTFALLGAKGLAETIAVALRDPDMAQHAFERYEKNYQDFLQTWLDFVRFFYDRTKNKEEYWERAQQAIDPDRLRPKKQDFAILLSGVIGLHEVFDVTAGALADDAPRPSGPVYSFD